MIRYLGYLKHGSKLYFCFPDSLESSGIDFILHSYFVSHHHPFRCRENENTNSVRVLKSTFFLGNSTIKNVQTKKDSNDL